MLRRIGKVALLTSLLLALALTALYWLSHRESTLAWLLKEVSARSGGRIVFNGISGSAYGPLLIQEISWRSEDAQLVARNVELDWTPALERHIHIDYIRISELHLWSRKERSAKPAVPQNLRLPFTFTLAEGAVKKIFLRNEQPEPTEPLASDLLLDASYDGAHYDLHLQRGRLSEASARFRGRLASDSPFALKGEGELISSAEKIEHPLRFHFSGVLERIALASRLKLRSGDAEMDASITPFAALLIARLEIKLGQLNANEWLAQAPRTRIDGNVVMQSASAETLAGSLVLRNFDHGAIDRDRLPIANLRGRFSVAQTGVAFPQLELDMGEAGTAAGSGSVHRGKGSFQLATRNLNMAGLWKSMRSTRLQGSISTAIEPDRQRVNLDLRKDKYRLQLDAEHRHGQVIVDSAKVQGERGRVVGRGRLSLTKARPFEFSGSIDDFDPAEFGRYPSARINGNWRASGQSSPALQAVLRVQVKESELRGQPLAATLDAEIFPSRIKVSALEATLGQNRIKGAGAFGAAGDELIWKIDAPRLDQLQAGLAGEAEADGALGDTFARPSIRYRIRAKGVRWEQSHRLASLRAEGSLRDENIRTDLEASGVRVQNAAVDDIRLQIQGARAQHAIGFTARSQSVAVEGAATGALGPGLTWRGELRSLDNRGKHSFALQAPARLEWSRDAWRIVGARFSFQSGHIRVDRLEKSGARIRTEGDAKGLAVGPLLALASPRIAEQSSIAVSGYWKLAVEDSVNGEIRLERANGDIWFKERPREPLGLKSAAIAIDIERNAIDLKFEARSQAAGQASGRLRTVLSKRNDDWGIARDAPLRAHAGVELQSLYWFAPFMENAFEIDGTLRAQLTAEGTLAKPNLRGSAEGARMVVRHRDAGIELKDGRLALEFTEQGGTLQELTFRGERGTLRAKGTLTNVQGAPALAIDFALVELDAFTHPDWQVQMSGDGKLTAEGKQIVLKSDLQVDRGSISLPEANSPSLGKDVVIVSGKTVTASKRKQPLGLRAEVKLDLGEQFYLRGSGIDAALRGVLTIRASEDGTLRAVGTVTASKGTYYAYGQRLTIERALLTFSGPLDNPAINALAMRKNQAVEAGVEVSGTLRAPAVKLVSTPPVPESEKLAWLVLGHGLEGATKPELELLGVAAGALLSRGQAVPLQMRIARSIGLDEINFSGASGGFESAMLTLGKRVSAKVYVSVEQSLRGAGSLARLRYDLSPRWYIQAVTGTDNAVDLFFKLSFD